MSGRKGNFGGQKHANNVQVWKLPPEEWQTPEKLAMLEGWSRDGYTLKEVATMMGLSTGGLADWRKKFPKIDNALKVGMTETNYMVENALLKLALGYQTEEVKVITTVRHGKTVETITERLTREQPPSVAAIQTWLYNRSKDKWRNMNTARSILDELDEETSVSITIERPSKNSEGSDQVRRPINDDEEDQDWMQGVNESVTVRGLSKQEKQAQRKKRKKREELEEETSESQKLRKNKETLVQEEDSEEFSDEEWEEAMAEFEE